MSPEKAVFFNDKENVSPIGKTSHRKPRTACANTRKRLEKALENEFAVMSPVRMRGNLDRTMLGPLDQSLLNATINASMNASMFQPGGGLNLTLLCNENSICEEESVPFCGEKRALEAADEPPAKRLKTNAKRSRTLAFKATGDAAGRKRKRARKSRVVTKAKRRISVRKASMKRSNKSSARKRVGRKKTPRRACKAKRASQSASVSASASPEQVPETTDPMLETSAAPALSPIKAAPVSPKTERRQVKSVSKSLSKSFRQERKEEIRADEFFLKLKDGPEPDLTRERFQELMNKLHDLGRIFLQDDTIYRV